MHPKPGCNLQPYGQHQMAGTVHTKYTLPTAGHDAEQEKKLLNAVNIK